MSSKTTTIVGEEWLVRHKGASSLTKIRIISNYVRTVELEEFSSCGWGPRQFYARNDLNFIERIRSRP